MPLIEALEDSGDVTGMTMKIARTPEFTEAVGSAEANPMYEREFRDAFKGIGDRVVRELFEVLPEGLRYTDEILVHAVSIANQQPPILLPASMHYLNGATTAADLLGTGAMV
ncbi:MAG TPA: hypothetical protein PKB09_01610 [Candidatus Saccharibacteria bacterium]|nr:hypothetical protein [Candidatus Saccharibacteria bacterium]